MSSNQNDNRNQNVDNIINQLNSHATDMKKNNKIDENQFDTISRFLNDATSYIKQKSS